LNDLHLDRSQRSPPEQCNALRFPPTLPPSSRLTHTELGGHWLHGLTPHCSAPEASWKPTNERPNSYRPIFTIKKVKWTMPQ